ncbi:hypothetical protein FB480_103551 [Agrobacterium vitis]|nr:hypothetical protein FB480_103551 [Agrobacterium vitis]
MSFLFILLNLDFKNIIADKDDHISALLFLNCGPALKVCVIGFCFPNIRKVWVYQNSDLWPLAVDHHMGLAGVPIVTELRVFHPQTQKIATELGPAFINSAAFVFDAVGAPRIGGF